MLLERRSCSSATEDTLDSKENRDIKCGFMDEPGYYEEENLTEWMLELVLKYQQ